MPQEISEIANKVKDLIKDSLEYEEDLTLKENLIRDLEAESLDFLDIVFRIEQDFGVRVERGYIEKMLREDFEGIDIKPNTELTPEMRTSLSGFMPEVAPEEFEKISKVKEITKTFTVASFVRITCQALLSIDEAPEIKGGPVDGYSLAALGCDG